MHNRTMTNKQELICVECGRKPRLTIGTYSLYVECDCPGSDYRFAVDETVNEMEENDLPDRWVKVGDYSDHDHD